VQFAKEKGLKIKLVAKVLKTENHSVALYVAPQFVSPDEYIYNVEDEYNGVVIEGAFYDKQFMFGKGAGAFPTGSAVLSDITALSHNYKYEYKKLKYFRKPTFSNQIIVTVYLRYTREEDLQYFNFKEITEQYSGKETHFVVGKIELAKLVEMKKIIEELDVFLGVMED
jgi:homoserine dehydrogenase